MQRSGPDISEEPREQRCCRSVPQNGVEFSADRHFEALLGIRVPVPSIPCAETNGYIWLHLEFTPLKPRLAGILPAFCAGGAAGSQPILDRAETWMVLRPGDALRRTVPRERLLYSDKEPGTYEFWAEYSPPALGAADLEVLQRAGIYVPRTTLTSGHIAFRKEP